MSGTKIEMEGANGTHTHTCTQLSKRGQKRVSMNAAFEITHEPYPLKQDWLHRTWPKAAVPARRRRRRRRGSGDGESEQRRKKRARNHGQKNGSARAAHMHIDHTAAAARQERTSLPSFRFFFAWSRLSGPYFVTVRPLLYQHSFFLLVREQIIGPEWKEDRRRLSICQEFALSSRLFGWAG